VQETAEAHAHRQLLVAVQYLRSHLLGTVSPGASPGLPPPPGFPSAGAMTHPPPELLLLVADEQDSTWQQQNSAAPAVCAITMHQYVAFVCGERGAAPHPLWELLDAAVAARQSSLLSGAPPPATASASAVAASAASSQHGHSPFLSASEVRRGLQAGDFVTGELNVFPYSTQEAEVVFAQPLPLVLPGTGSSNSSSSGRSSSISSCLVCGLGHRNRALQGDVVVVQVGTEQCTACYVFSPSPPPLGPLLV
jgi:hypothetical protein